MASHQNLNAQDKDPQRIKKTDESYYLFRLF